MRLSKKGKIEIALVVFLILVAVLYFLIYIAPGISDVFVETYTAEYGTLDVDYQADGVVVRTERLYTADYPGAVVRVADEGSLKTVSSNIVNVGGTAYYCQERGNVGYKYDDMETVFTPDTMMTLGPDSVYPDKDENGESVYQLKDCVSEEAIAGDPIYKIYDNQTWYIMTFLERDAAVAVRDAGTVSVELPDENDTILKFRVLYVDEIEEETEETQDTQDTQATQTTFTDSQDKADQTDQTEPQGPAGTIKTIGENAKEPKDLIDGTKLTEGGQKLKPVAETAKDAKAAADAAAQAEAEAEAAQSTETGETGEGETPEGEGENPEGGDNQTEEPENQVKLYRVILSCNRYYSELGSARYGTFRIITAHKTGIILETDSIVTVDGKKGVYVVNKYGDYVFTPISIIGVVGDKTVVESHTFYDRETDTTYYTVDNYDSIKKRGVTEDVDQG